MEIASKGMFKEMPHNSHPCELARNGLCKECGLCCVYHSSVGGSIWPA